MSKQTFWGNVNLKRVSTGILWGPGVGLTSSLDSGQNPTEGTKQKQTGCWTGPVLSIHHITPTANNTTALRSGPQQPHRWAPHFLGSGNLLPEHFSTCTRCKKHAALAELGVETCSKRCGACLGWLYKHAEQTNDIQEKNKIHDSWIWCLWTTERESSNALML